LVKENIHHEDPKTRRSWDKSLDTTFSLASSLGGSFTASCTSC
jgi:hypothetical protein